MVLTYREDGKKKFATALGYDFRDSYRIIKEVQAKRLGVKPQAKNGGETRREKISPTLKIEVLLAGFPASADVLAGVENQRRMWAKAMLAMQADRAMRSEEDELFWLVCAAVAN